MRSNVYSDKDRFWNPVDAGILCRPIAWRHGSGALPTRGPAGTLPYGLGRVQPLALRSSLLSIPKQAGIP
ncbi:hypothetical protein AB0K55_37500, partial [Streptomyces massasporeus]